jgi:ubiquinone/menaquinone biosynthesis C-methylase UbiE
MIELKPGDVEKHYTTGTLFNKIISLFEQQGIAKITLKHLSSLDEFHLRGAAASVELAREAGLEQDDKVLDVGCGIGGPARMLADRYGCHVTGVDLTSEFIHTATQLSDLTGYRDKTTFIYGNALSLPFPDDTFDAVWTQHVQMNVEDKKTFYSEIHRVLKKDGALLFHDIFSRNGEILQYPVPWAEDKSISHLITTSELHQLLTSLGFYIRQTRDQTNEAIEFLEKMSDDSVAATPFSSKIMMGSNGGEKINNLLRNLREEKLTVQSGVFWKQ